MLPVLLQTSFVTIYSYPLFWGVSWAIGYYYAKANLDSVLHQKLLILFSTLFATTWMGAKVMFYISLPDEWKAGVAVSENFWMGGGFSFFGGLIAGLMTAMIFLKLWKNAGEEILKKLILAIPIAHAVGRIGCFLAGCCYGTHGIPVQLIESFLLLVLFWWMRKKFQKHSLKKISFFYLFSYSIIRLGLDFFRGDMLNILWELKETQLIAIVIIICSLMFKLFIENKKYVSS